MGMAKRKADLEEVAEVQTVSAVSKRKPTEPKKHSRKRQKTDVVSLTNALSFEAFSTAYVTQNLLQYPPRNPESPHINADKNLALDLCFVNDLPDPSIHACFDLIQSTSRPDYEASSDGWRPKQKLREMKQAEMRYLIARQQHSTNDLAVSGKRPSEELKGFLSFMITHEDGLPVLYVYEIHLAQDARGRGLGKHLMHVAYKIAEKVGGLKKVMLTCFVSNTEALEFYRRLGYEVDENSPADRRTRGKLMKADYVIMSRRVASSTEVKHSVSMEQTSLPEGEQATC